MSENGYIRLCHYDDLKERNAMGFDTTSCGQDTLFLVKSEGKIYAWKNACPHISGAPMAWKRHGYMNASGDYIECHAHGALFDPKTGVCIQGPCLGKRLEPIVLETHTDGSLMIAVAEDS
jgi:nitrite reductase/ring-hydroxylating ferredoxin subunit